MSSLFEQIDNEIDTYRQRAWPAVLPFNGFKCSRVEDVPSAGNFCYHDDVDLFEEVRNVLFTNIIIRFDPGRYPINGGWDKTVEVRSFLPHFVQLLRSQEGAT